MYTPWFVLCILDSYFDGCNCSTVKILVIVGKLVENDSLELRKIAAAETLLELLEPSVKISW